MHDVDHGPAGRGALFMSPGNSLCHDLKQPVAAILAMASEAASLPDGELGRAARLRVRQIEHQALVLAEMIDATLDPASSLGAGEQTADLDATLGAVVSVARLTYPGHIALVRGARKSRVAANHVLVRRVVANVLANAVRAGGADGTVWVSSRLARARAVVDIDDNGPGWGRIEPGHGLGLAYVTEVLQAIGGGIAVRQTRVGRTRVRLEFPLAPATG